MDMEYSQHKELKLGLQSAKLLPRTQNGSHDGHRYLQPKFS